MTVPTVPLRRRVERRFTRYESARNRNRRVIVGARPLQCRGTTSAIPGAGHSPEFGCRRPVTATDERGAAVTGLLTLGATGSGPVADTGSYNVTVSATLPTVTILAPVLTSGQRAVVSNRQPLVRALLKANGGAALDTTRT